MKKIISLCTVICAGLMLFTLCGCDDGSSWKTVTLAEYNQVQYGMTHDEVVAIFGEDPNSTESVTTGQYAYTGTVERWINDDGSYASCTFSNGKLVLKYEQNLK